MSVPAAIDKWASLIEKCRRPEIELNLLLALCWQESSGNHWAIRYEPGYEYFVQVDKKRPLHDVAQSAQGNRIRALQILGATEFHAQSTSYGLLQLMGATARDVGFKGKYLTELCDPEINIAYGSMFLWDYCFKQGKNSTEHALLRYNGGGNKNYPDEVLAKLKLF